MRTERHIFREQKVRVQKTKFLQEVEFTGNSDQPEIRRRSPPLLNCSNSQMPNRSGILTILSNSSRLSLMILVISRVGATPMIIDLHFSTSILSLTLLVQFLGAIDDDLLFSLDSTKEFHISAQPSSFLRFSQLVSWSHLAFYDPTTKKSTDLFLPSFPFDSLTSLNTTHENWVVDFLWN